MNVDGTIYSEGKYEVHSWLKDSFNKPLYAGSDIIHFDNNSPVFEATLLRSNAVIIDLVINDLTFDFKKFSQDLISNPILINDNFSIGILNQTVLEKFNYQSWVIMYQISVSLSKVNHFGE